jgi:hypothetical protein
MVYHQNDRKVDHAILDGPVGKCTLFEKIKLLDRWSSDSYLRYIRV